jgi:hypothetical protein
MYIHWALSIEHWEVPDPVCGDWCMGCMAACNLPLLPVMFSVWLAPPSSDDQCMTCPSVPAMISVWLAPPSSDDQCMTCPSVPAMISVWLAPPSSDDQCMTCPSVPAMISVWLAPPSSDDQCMTCPSFQWRPVYDLPLLPVMTSCVCKALISLC